LTAAELHNLFEQFREMRVLIIGDVMIDAYTWGKVSRISPEAPVPIVAVEKQENRLGGAANVALNIAALGATPYLCAVTGNDDDAKIFDSLLEKNNMSNEGILRSSKRFTTVKTRIIGNNHQMLRIDKENDSPLNEDETFELSRQIEWMVAEHKINVIIFEDYDKGVITPSLINKVVEIAKNHKIPVAVDPKKRNFLHYHKVNLFKPNLKELKEGLNIEIDTGNNASLENAAKIIREKLQAEMALITLSEKGVLINTTKENLIIPAHVRDIADVSGAGDTVISVAALCLAAGIKAADIAALANLAGGLVCEHVGVVSINIDELRKEALTLCAK
jgi:D-glycero-beta-D-manno-heptose-7-phosphate kinase